MRSITAVITGTTREGGLEFTENFSYNEPTTAEECAALVGDVVRFVADNTSRMRENGVRNGLISLKKGANLHTRFESLVKTYGDAWAWSPRGEGVKALSAKLSAAQAAGDLQAVGALIAELAAKYASAE